MDFSNDQEDTPDDWLFCMRLFGRALGFVLKKGEGIVINIDEKQYVVSSGENETIEIWNSENEEKLSEGTRLWNNDRRSEREKRF